MRLRCASGTGMASRVAGSVFASLATLVLLTGCFSATLRGVDSRLQELMVGVAAADVVSVYGPPTGVKRDGEVEYLEYQWTIPNVQRTVERRSNSHIPSKERFQVDANCKVTLQTRSGVVTDVDAVGTTTRNGIFTNGCARMFLALAERREP